MESRKSGLKGMGKQGTEGREMVISVGFFSQTQEVFREIHRREWIKDGLRASSLLTK